MYKIKRSSLLVETLSSNRSNGKAERSKKEARKKQIKNVQA